MKKLLATALTASTIAAGGIAAAAPAEALTTYTLKGTAWYDANVNSRFDAGDWKAAGHTVSVYNRYGKLVSRVKTDRYGNYFARAPRGTYRVAITMNAGERLNRGNSVWVGGNTAFNLPILPSHTFYGTAWYDVNRNQRFDTGDYKAAGHTVSVYNTVGTFIKSVKTDARGNFATQLPVWGDYRVKISTNPGEWLGRDNLVKMRGATAFNLPIYKPAPTGTVKPAAPAPAPSGLTTPAGAIAKVNALRAARGLSQLPVNSRCTSYAQKVAADSARAGTMVYGDLRTCTAGDPSVSGADFPGVGGSFGVNADDLIARAGSRIYDPKANSLAVAFAPDGTAGVMVITYGW